MLGLPGQTKHSRIVNYKKEMCMSKLDRLMKLEKEILSKAPGRLFDGNQAGDVLTNRLPSGIASLDAKLGGGFPRSMITHIYGNKSCGKSSTVIQTIANLHKSDPEAIAVVANCEGYWQSSNMDYVKRFGCDLSRIRIISSPHSEEVLDISEKLIMTKAIDLFVLDSLAGLMASTELDKSMVDNERIGENARLIQRFIKKVTSALQPQYNKELKEIEYNPCTVILINQVRTHFNRNYVSQAPTGGMSVPFFSAIEINCTAPRSEFILYEADKGVLAKYGNTAQAKEYMEEAMIGKKIYYSIEKNRTFPSEGQKATADFYNKDLMYPSPTGFQSFGFDVVASLFTSAVDLGVITGATWLTFDEYKAQGRNNFIEAMRIDSGLFSRIQARVAEVLLQITEGGACYASGENIPDAEEREPEQVSEEREEPIQISTDADSEELGGGESKGGHKKQKVHAGAKANGKAVDLPKKGVGGKANKGGK
jgi:RecA/RadA recombinase